MGEGQSLDPSVLSVDTRPSRNTATVRGGRRDWR